MDSFLPLREETSAIIYDTKPSKNINGTRQIHSEPELSFPTGLTVLPPGLTLLVIEPKIKRTKKTNQNS